MIQGLFERTLTGVAASAMMGAAADDAGAWIRAWDGQGLHRTATPGDVAGAEWLAQTATSLGASPIIENFDLQRVERRDAFVEIDGARLQGESLWDAPDTSVIGESALASLAGGGGFVGIAELSPLAVYAPDFAEMRRGVRQRVLVIVTKGGAPGLALFNAESFRAPYGLPVLLLPSTDRETVFAAMGRGAGFRVVTQTSRTQAQGRNIVVTLKGRDPSRAPLVVMTPRSAWYQSTSERGGGLVCWLETLRALIAAPPSCDVILTANSGHELGHIGLDAFMAARPGLMARATWLHFGANIGAAGGRLALQSPQEDLRTLAAGAMAQAGQEATLLPPAQVPNGESRDIHRAGGRYITLVGSNALFHLPQDRWPDAVDLPAVTRAAQASARMAVALTR